MGKTKRPQNKCKSCGYTWYPKGKDISLKCPSCSSTNVSIVGTGSLVLGALVVGYMMFGGGTKPPPESLQNVGAIVTPAEPINSPVLVREEVLSLESAAPRVHTSSQVSASDGKMMSKRADIDAISETPTSICRNESNFIFKNNCMWKECAKPEFSDLQECENKKNRTERE